MFCPALLSRQCKIVDRSYTLWICSTSPLISRSHSYSMLSIRLLSRSFSCCLAKHWLTTASHYAIACGTLVHRCTVWHCCRSIHTGRPSHRRQSRRRVWRWFQMLATSSENETINIYADPCTGVNCISRVSMANGHVHITRKQTECVDMRFAIFDSKFTPFNPKPL